jgi:SAM-dependent methyltransferase
MSGNEYVYSGLLARTWDIWRDDTRNWSDRDLYLSVLQRYGQPVLDIGCGTGRLLLDYLNLGIDVDGIDNAPEMLAICRQKALALERPAQEVDARVLLQALETLDLPRRYRTLLAPSSVLQLFFEPERAANALARAFEHLRPGGAFIASFGFVWQPGQALETDWSLLFAKQRPEDGATVRSWKREWCEPERQWWHSEQRFEVELNGVVIESELQRLSPAHRWFTQEQAAALVRGAGFTGIEVLHGFSGEPAEPDAQFFCVLGVKPG